MRVLLDTNIIIHREASSAVNTDIGVLFKWLDDLHYTKCVHPITVEEISRYQDPKTVKTMNIKVGNYHILRTEAPIQPELEEISKKYDNTANDLNDTRILNELFAGRVDILITEDRKLIHKASLLNIFDKVFTIDAFLEKVTAENPGLQDYRVLSVKKELFGNIDNRDHFFDSFKEDYPDFIRWFNKKADETVYTYRSENNIMAFLYLKTENQDEDYSDITPTFTRKRRLKIGSFKVTINGYKLGERFLKIIFDNALRLKVEEIYVTIFNRRIEQQRLINLMEDYGFKFYGYKGADGELVYVRDFTKESNVDNPKIYYPFFTKNRRAFIVPIYPEYHTDLFPDSILKNESPQDYVENESYRNAISKVYISRSFERGLKKGDLIIFYRTGGYYKGVVTTLGIVENVITDIRDEQQFISLCRKRSVFSDRELSNHWNYNKHNRPFVVNFLYVCSFPKRPNLKRLIEMGVIPSIDSVPRGFTLINEKDLENIIREAGVDESIIVN